MKVVPLDDLWLPSIVYNQDNRVVLSELFFRPPAILLPARGPSAHFW